MFCQLPRTPDTGGHLHLEKVEDTVYTMKKHFLASPNTHCLSSTLPHICPQFRISLSFMECCLKVLNTGVYTCVYACVCVRGPMSDAPKPCCWYENMICGMPRTLVHTQGLHTHAHPNLPICTSLRYSCIHMSDFCHPSRPPSLPTTAHFFSELPLLQLEAQGWRGGPCTEALRLW